MAGLDDEIRRLEREQRKARGTQPHVFLGEKLRIIGPYEPTPENEARAWQIVRLRRQAARLKHARPS
jgi:hypothetical protein